MRTATYLLIACILLATGGRVLAADSQTDIQRKAEFRKLILERNRLHRTLQQYDLQAAEMVKQNKDATKINAEQVTTQDRLDLLQLRIETMAARYDFEIPALPDDSTAAETSQYGLGAFERGRQRTKEELKRQTLRLLASIDYSQFRAQMEDD